MNVGHGYQLLGEYCHAIEYREKSLAIQREIGDRHSEAKSLGNLGNAYNSLGEYRRATDYHKASLAIQYELKDRWGQAASTFNLGTIQEKLGDIAEARQSMASAQKLFAELGVNHWAKQAEANLVRLESLND